MVHRGKRQRDRHDWNTYENYRVIYEQCVVNHPFRDQTKPLPEFELLHTPTGLFVTYSGDIYCCDNNIILSVDKYYFTRDDGDGRLRLRCFSYSYNGWISGKHNIIRYDNNDDFDDYHKHVFDTKTGKQLQRITISRNEFPVLSEVIDELQQISSNLI